jgi:predicted amidophosphoribosyltransferase
MTTVSEFTEPFGNFMFNPLRADEPNVCRRCLTFANPGYQDCYSCGQRRPEWPAEVVCPISYAIKGEQLYRLLYGYKGSNEEARGQFRLALAAILWRWIQAHEGRLAEVARVGSAEFEVVTTVPSSDPARVPHPLGQIVSETVKPLAGRYAPVLERSGKEVESRVTDREKYRSTENLDGRSVLLIEDTWVSGANAESAGGALKDAGAGAVATVVIGRLIDRDYQDNDRRLRGIPTPFDWGYCAR